MRAARSPPAAAPAAGAGRAGAVRSGAHAPQRAAATALPGGPAAVPQSIGNQALQHAAAASAPGAAAGGAGMALRGPVGRRGDRFERDAQRHADAVASSLERPAPGADAPGGAALAPALRARIEPRTGADLRDARVHAGPRSRQAAAVLGARAFTAGHDIHLGAGASAADTRLVAHEAVHVAQQAGDPAAPRLQLDASNQSLTPGYAAALDDGDLMFELQTAEGLLRDAVPGDPTHEAITANLGVLRTEYFSRDPGVNAEASDALPPPAPPRVTEIPEGGTEIGRVGVVAWDGEPALRLRATPDTAGENVVATLAMSTRLQVIKSFPGDWYFVSTPAGNLGYVASNYVFMDLPEPNARLHRVAPGLAGTAIAIAERYYGEYANDWGQDLRFYINVLAWANRIGVPNSTFGWRQVRFRAGDLIWIPSQRFAYGLKGAVNSGSISWNIADAVGLAGFLDRLGELWDDFGRALDYSAEYRAEALANRIEEAARGMVEGLVTMIKLAVAILAITTAVGAILGGVFGVGAGAAPGAAAGFEVGLVIIQWLGLGLLMVWIASSLIDLGAAFGRFLGTVWDARGDREVLRRAGAQWADAIALLIAKILEGLLMLVMARGLPKGFEALRGTRLGSALGESRAMTWLSQRAASVEAGTSRLPGPSTVIGRIRGTARADFEPVTMTVRGNGAAFHDLPPGRLPANLPEGHAWARNAEGTEWVLTRRPDAPPAPFELTVYADAAGNTNYVLRSGDRMIQSDAITRTGGTHSGADRLPPSLEETGAANPYRDPVTGRPWDKGHGIDHADTLQGPGVISSTTDAANFTPQASWWNQGPRNSLVGRIRDGHAASGRPGGGGYREMAIYAETPPVTANGTPIPGEFVFVETNAAGVAVRAWRIPNIQNAAGRAITAIDPMAIPLADVPPVLLRSGMPLAGPGGAGASYAPGIIFGVAALREDDGDAAAGGVCEDPGMSPASVDAPVCE